MKMQKPLIEAQFSVSSLVYILSAVASPFLGILVDFTGHNLFWVLFGMVLTLVAHVLYAFTVTLTPIFIAVSLSLEGTRLLGRPDTPLTSPTSPL